MAPLLPPSEIIRRAFPGIGVLEAEALAQTGKTCSYPADTILCHEDALEDIFYILIDGEVQVAKSIDASEIRILNHLRPGDFFGEMALINNAPRAATVTTKTPITVIEINRENFNSLLQENASVSLAMVRHVSQRLRDNDQMAIEDLRVKARELADAHQQLAEMDYARREFLSTIAHELRTPLTAANGFLQLVRLGMVQGETMHAALDTVTRNLQEIISLVNDLLFLQEMDLILTEFQPTDIGVVVASTVEQYRNMAKRNQVGMSLSISSNLPLIRADTKSLGRAITAILDNAIKFSPDGGEVRVEACKDGDEVLVVVQDRGVGIPAEALPHIFKRFYRVEDIGGRLFRGLGLGLSIARQVVEQHGGTIDVKSELGKGSTFTVRLKAEA